MPPKQKILNYVQKRHTVTGKELSDVLGISRQAVNKHLKILIQDNRIVKEGSTKGTTYRMPSSRREPRSVLKIKKSYNLKGLEEDQVFLEIAPRLNLNKELNKSAFNKFFFLNIDILFLIIKI